jgi:cysteinyl-tRNA synthetase
VDPCRALGNTLEIIYTGGEKASLVNSTLYGQGDGLVFSGSREGSSCDGSETFQARNNIFHGDEDFNSPGDQTFLFYQEECSNLKLDSDDNLIYQAKNVVCGTEGDYVASGAHDSCQDPQLSGPLSGETFGVLPLAKSPAIDTGDDAICPPVDILGQPRPADGDLDGTPVCDIGAYEIQYQAFLPLTQSTTRVNDFLYQLQNLDLDAVGDTAYDLVVMDYSAEGDDESAYSSSQIAALKNSPGGSKIALAYMSIGEAEDYRFYWQDGWEPGNPSWLDEENPDWEGNYKVHYWDSGWQAIIFEYIDRLLAAGFDGAYLDIIDGYEYYQDKGRDTAAQEMVDFVAAIRAYMRAQDADFILVVQNAPELAQLIPGYLDHLDGIGQEDIYYGYEDDDQMTPPSVTSELESHLDAFLAAGKLVLTVDYATTPAHIDDAYGKSKGNGYVPFCSVRDLDQLTINPGHEPD